ncbi:hypothetical protein Tco_0195678 [Tanacetum coccineum]
MYHSWKTLHVRESPAPALCTASAAARSIKDDLNASFPFVCHADDAVFIECMVRGNLNWYHAHSCCSRFISGLLLIEEKPTHWCGIQESQGFRAQLFLLEVVFTLLKSVLGIHLLFIICLSLTVPMAVLKSLDLFGGNFFNVSRQDGREKRLLGLAGLVLESKSNEVIHALHGSNKVTLSASYSSLWSSIIKECNALKSQGLLDVMLLPKYDVQSVVKQIPSKVNVLAWKISMDSLPTGLLCIGVEFSFNQVQNKCWKECFTLPGGVSGHIETISSSLIQIFEKMVFLKT